MKSIHFSNRTPILLLGFALLAPFLPMLLFPGGRVLGNEECDNPSMFYFINNFAGHCWRHGSVPLWNPHIMLGLPFLGEGQAAVFHPLSWLFILLPTGVAINWLLALSFLLTGLFFYGYLRALGLSRPAAAYGALVWCYSNVLVVRLYAGHLTILLELIEMPLILMLWERYRREPRIQYLAGIALAYAAMVLAAYPQLLYFFSLFFMFYVLLQSAPEALTRQGARAQGRMILMLGTFILLGVGIGAIQLFPSADFAVESYRRRGTYEFCTSFSFEPANLLTLLVPRIFGYAPEAGVGQYWALWNFWEISWYLGILPLMLILPGLIAAPWRRRVVFIPCAVLFFVVALGKYTPLFPLLYRHMPFFNVFRSPSKCMIMTELCMVVFSAFGVESILHPAGCTPGASAPAGAAGAAPPGGRWRFLAALGGGVLVLAGALAIYFTLLYHYAEPGSHWRNLLVAMLGHDERSSHPEVIRVSAQWAARELGRAALFIVLSLGVLAVAWSGKWRRALPALVFLVTLSDLLCLFLPLMKTYDEKITNIPEEFVEPLQQTPYPARLLGTMLTPNIAMHHGFSSASGYSGNTLQRFNNFVNAVLGQTTDTTQVRNPIHQYKSGYRFLAHDVGVVKKQDFKKSLDVLARSPELYLVRFPEPFPRAYLAATPKRVAGAPAALNYVVEENESLQLSPCVEGEVSVPPAPVSKDETVRFISFSPNRVELEALTAQPRLLVLGEMYEKNWTASINRRSIPILPTNYLFRGVEVPQGISRVVFEYSPASFRWGASISLLSLAGVIWIGWRKQLRGWAKRVAAKENSSGAEAALTEDHDETSRRKIEPGKHKSAGKKRERALKATSKHE